MKKNVFWVSAGLLLLVVSSGILWICHTMNTAYRQSLMASSDKGAHCFVEKRRSKIKKYHNNGTIEHIVFSVPEERGSQKNILRRGILVTRPHARATVVICHGFMCNKHDVSFLRTVFEDYNVLVFDFRAHGENTDNQCSSFGVNEVLDLEAAVAFVKSKPGLTSLPIIGYGFSMGAVTAILAQAQHPDMFSALILDCPFDSTEMVINRLLGQLSFTVGGYQYGLPGRDLLKRYMYNPSIQAMIKWALKAVAHVGHHDIPVCIVPSSTIKAIESVTIPTLFITCKNDDKAPVEAVRSIYDHKPGFKRLWITNGRTHFDSFFYNPEKYIHKVRVFVKKFLDDQLKNKVESKIIEDTDDAFVHKEVA